MAKKKKTPPPLTKFEKAKVWALRIFGALALAFGLFLVFYSIFGLIFMVTGAISFILAFGLKGDYEYESEQRELRKKEAAAQRRQARQAQAPAIAQEAEPTQATQSDPS